MLRAAGTIVGLGAKTMGSNNSGTYIDSRTIFFVTCIKINIFIFINSSILFEFSADFDDDKLFDDLRIGDERDEEKDVFA